VDGKEARLDGRRLLELFTRKVQQAELTTIDLSIHSFGSLSLS